MNRLLAALILLAATGWASSFTTLATGLSSLDGITVAGTNIYFVSITGGNSPSISSMSTNGGSITPLYGNLVSPNDLAVVNNSLFWVDANSGPVTDTQILSAPITGGGPVAAIYTGSLVGQPLVDGIGLVTDGSSLYASDEVDGRVFSLNPDGSGLTQLGSDRYSGFFSTEHGNWVAVANNVLYVLDGGRAGVISSQVTSIPAIGGPAFTPLWVGAPFSDPNAITEGNGVLYIADGSTIWAMPLTGGAPSIFFSGGPLVDIAESGLYYSQGALYVADTGSRSIDRIDITPEPATLALCGIGLGLVGFSLRQRRLCSQPDRSNPAQT
jgi:hypothetical protein